MAPTKRSKGGRAAARRAKTTASARAKGKGTPTKKAPVRAATKAQPAAKSQSAVKTKPAAAKRSVPTRNTKPAAAKPAATKAVGAKPVAAKPVGAKPGAAKPGAAKPGAAKPSALNAELTTLKNKFQRERSALEKRLTEAVREIGMLRHHELRVMQLERQLAERDAVIGRLQSQLGELERRPTEPVYVREVQQSLALGAPALAIAESATDLDEFDDDRVADDDGDVVTDDE